MFTLRRGMNQIKRMSPYVQDVSSGVRRARGLRHKINEVDAYASARGLPEPLRHNLAT